MEIEPVLINSQSGTLPLDHPAVMQSPSAMAEIGEKLDGEHDFPCTHILRIWAENNKTFDIKRKNCARNLEATEIKISVFQMISLVERHV